MANPPVIVLAPPPASADPATEPADDQPVTPDIEGPETEPPVATSFLLSKSQLRYCVFTKQRIEDINEPPVSGLPRQRYVAFVQDFDSRCGRVRYMSGDFAEVAAELPAARPRLQIEANALAGTWDH